MVYYACSQGAQMQSWDNCVWKVLPSVSTRITTGYCCSNVSRIIQSTAFLGRCLDTGAGILEERLPLEIAWPSSVLGTRVPPEIVSLSLGIEGNLTLCSLLVWTYKRRNTVIILRLAQGPMSCCSVVQTDISLVGWGATHKGRGIRSQFHGPYHETSIFLNCKLSIQLFWTPCQRKHHVFPSPTDPWSCSSWLKMGRTIGLLLKLAVHLTWSDQNPTPVSLLSCTLSTLLKTVKQGWVGSHCFKQLRPKRCFFIVHRATACTQATANQLDVCYKPALSNQSPRLGSLIGL